MNFCALQYNVIHSLFLFYCTFNQGRIIRPWFNTFIDDWNSDFQLLVLLQYIEIHKILPILLSFVFENKTPISEKPSPCDLDMIQIALYNVRLIVCDYNQRQFVLKQFNEVHLLCLISRMYINKYSFILDVLLKTFYLHNSMWCSNTTYVQRCPSHAQWKQKVRHIIRAACSKYCVSAFSENGHFRAKKLPTEKFL